MKRISQGAAHGRFQPFHNDHLRYCLAAKEKCDLLWIGITQPDVAGLSPSPKDEHRQERANNPLTYFERHSIVRASLLEAGLQRRDFEIIPFPIDETDRIVDFLPLSIPVFTTVNDKWNLHKIEVLKKVGYEIFVLWEEEKKYEGARIRELMSLGDRVWITNVPPTAGKLLLQLGIEGRIRSLRVD